MKYLKFLLLAALTVGVGGIRGLGQEVLSITDRLTLSPGVTLNQPDELTRRLAPVQREAADETATVAETPGRTERNAGVFRVEVFADNTSQARNHATARRHNIQSQFPQYGTQLVFESPFWRVKVGPFNSRSDAEAAMAEIRNAFPAYAPYLRIVRN